MFDLTLWLTALAVIAVVAVAAWSYTLVNNNVGIVDVLWSLMFLVAAVVYYLGIDEPVSRATLVLVLCTIWALRLAGYIAWRSHGEPEDHRYRTIRANNEPGFRYKSLYIVFGLQGLLAWIISLPLLAAIAADTPLGWLDMVALALWCVGMVFEAVGDYQLARFRRDPHNSGRVLDSGLWRFTRHPNYFGNFCIWWGFYLFALASGGWWAILSPLLMSVLLLKVSGVALLEKTITSRRPGYAEYVARTNAFFPGPPHTAK
jgi:steroid 5-alpha reductase family enzyme